MTPILDANGRALPPSDPEAQRGDILDAIVAEHAAHPERWTRSYQRYEALLDGLEGGAPQLHAIICGKVGIDPSAPQFPAMLQQLIEIAFLTLIFRRKELLEGAERAERNGPPPGPRLVKDEEAGDAEA